MDTKDAANSFAELFPRVFRRFCQRIPPSQHRLTGESMAILRHLADTGPLTVTEMARHLERSQAATSEIIARLVGRGLLDRMPDERDRRRVLVWLTPAGREMLHAAQEVLSPELLARGLRQLSPQRRRTLIEAVQALLATDPLPGEPTDE